MSLETNDPVSKEKMSNVMSGNNIHIIIAAHTKHLPILVNFLESSDTWYTYIIPSREPRARNFPLGANFEVEIGSWPS